MRFPSDLQFLLVTFFATGGKYDLHSNPLVRTGDCARVLWTLGLRGGSDGGIYTALRAHLFVINDVNGRQPHSWFPRLTVFPLRTVLDVICPNSLRYTPVTTSLGNSNTIVLLLSTTSVFLVVQFSDGDAWFPAQTATSLDTQQNARFSLPTSAQTSTRFTFTS